MTKDITIPDYDSCTGCNVCLLPCPVWRQHNDVALSQCGRARSMQNQAGARPCRVDIAELKESISACVVCGACGAICPAGLDTVAMTLDLRRRLADLKPSPLASQAAAAAHPPSARPMVQTLSAKVFIPDGSLRKHETIMKKIMSLLGASLSIDDGTDIVRNIEAGIRPDPERLTAWLRSLDDISTVISADGLLVKLLSVWLEGIRIIGLGEALLRIRKIRDSLNPSDMYIIEPRAYHAAFSRLAGFYDQVRQDTGCSMNLDLARTAITTASSSLQSRLKIKSIDQEETIRWIMKGRTINRIVVENAADITRFRDITEAPIVHVAELYSGA